MNTVSAPVANKVRTKYGIWSMVGTYILLVAVAIRLMPIQTIIRDFQLFFSGGVGHIVKGTGLVQMLSTVPWIVTIELFLSMLALFIVHTIVGKSGNNAIREYLMKKGEGYHFFTYFSVITLEELTARWIFLGLIFQLPFFHNPVGFYTLVLIGNSGWALLHLGNFADRTKRQPIRVLPQFIAGLLFSYLFVKFGFLACILAHFASNAIIFAMHKVQRVNWVDFALMLTNGIFLIVAGLLMKRPLSDMLQWLGRKPEFKLPGWGFWDYLLAALFIGSAVSLILDLLLYDRNSVGKEKKQTPVLLTVLYAIPTLCIVYTLYWIAGLSGADTPIRVLIVALILCFSMKNPSANAGMRTFWEHIPGIFIFVCIVNALGFVGGLGYLFVSTALSLPETALNRLND